MQKPRLSLPIERVGKIRRKANGVLAAAGITSAPVPIERVASSLGAEVRYAPYEGNDLAGMLIRQGNQTLIGVNSSHHRNRQRFTIAHECGHLMLHADGVYIDKAFEVFRRDEKSSEASDPREIEANQCAAELLMPVKFLFEDLRGRLVDLEDGSQIAELAKRYGVSAQAMTYRIANVFM